LRILERNEEVVVKGLNFSSGTIEYDLEPEDPGFAGIYFRRVDKRENEYFYLRLGDAGKPLAIDGIQYARSSREYCCGICFPGTRALPILK
jgi:hypothetical protein